ncbi:hypothetical protein GCM10009085_00810 [Pseudomonas avellanae]|nr:hypothetical protein GCM10009085_00810 [Pseudomonas avellanae]
MYSAYKWYVSTVADTCNVQGRNPSSPSAMVGFSGISRYRRCCDTDVYKRYISRRCHEPVESASRLHPICGGANLRSCLKHAKRSGMLDAAYG